MFPSNGSLFRSGNFLLFLNFADPGNQLSWLVDELQKSENANEKVHVITHHPPKSCLQGWRREFTKIINRYESTVVGLFFGHTHNDFFQVRDIIC